MKRTSYVVRTTQGAAQHYVTEGEAWVAYRTLLAFGISASIMNTTTQEYIV